MTLDVRLAEIVSGLEEVGVRCLVMGGHAVRYYGFHRDTNDFDLCLAPEAWDDLPARIARSNLGGGKPLAEGPSWRIGAFRRFELERFPDGREQWLEFWRTNHLLDDFSRLHDRRENGFYGGRSVPFLALADLIRSKETEREKDWRDIEYLEEIQDQRNLALVRDNQMSAKSALSVIRSRRGLESFHFANLLQDAQRVASAVENAVTMITAAYLLPFAPHVALPRFAHPIESPLEAKLRQTPPLSNLHWLLVTAVRRQYQWKAQAIDRADKEAIRAAQNDRKGQVGPT